MKKTIIIIVTIVFSFFFQQVAEAQGIVFSDIPWAEALAKAKKENKYILVDASTSWAVISSHLLVPVAMALLQTAIHHVHSGDLEHLRLSLQLRLICVTWQSILESDHYSTSKNT